MGSVCPSVKAACDQLADLDAEVDRLTASSALEDCEVVRLAVSDPPPIDLPAALTAALAKPVGTPPLRNLATGRHSAVIITSDATRATPSREMIGSAMKAQTDPERCRRMTSLTRRAQSRSHLSGVVSAKQR